MDHRPGHDPVVTRRLFGFDFISEVGPASVAERIMGVQPVDDRLPLVVTPNVDDLVQLSHPVHSRLAAAERRARYVLPDGQPIVWTSRLAGTPLRRRLPGSSLFPELWRRAIDGRRGVLLITASDEVAAGLRAEYPDAVTYTPPMFNVADRDVVERIVGDCADLVERHGSEFVFTGVGFPKQQHLALGLLEELGRRGLPLPTVLLLGGSFNMHLGLIRRAPRWVQQAGLEWFYRFLHEPRRLFRRYFIMDVRFLPMMIREARTVRSRERRG
jgi:N-acetylglucosaminyldiphosphoundecaprenol N-acetyl-beta-D-mannosaminyltransferase